MYRSKAAVVGTGFIGPVHIESLQRAGVRVVGVLGTSSDKSQQAANKFGIPRAYNDLEELVADTDVDVVHLTSPNRYHFEQARRCLESGKHVLCEKPLAMTSSESRQLVDIAAAKRLKNAVNYNVRFYPLCIEAAQRIRRGDLGRIFHITGSYVQDWLHKDTDFNWRVLASEGGELRAVADIGTHWLDLVHFISGLGVSTVCADLQTVYAQRLSPAGGVETFSSKINSIQSDVVPVSIDTEDYGSILLKFENGSCGVMHVSQVTAGHKNCIRWEVAGSKQSLGWNSQRPDELWVGNRDRANETLIRDPGLLSDEARFHAQYPGGHNEGFSDTFKQLFRAFYENIEHPDSPNLPSYPTFEDGHREIVLCEAILKSAQQQRWIEL